MYRRGKILIIEDDISISDILSFALKKEGYEVQAAMNGRSGLEAFEKFKPNLLILDIMLPDISGFDICKAVACKIPTIMITARNDIVDKVLGIELGADDYITKPFDIREVVVRVKAAFRRVDMITNMREETENLIKVNSHISINKESRTVYKDDISVRLKPKEYDLLLVFVENRQKVFTREQLLNMVWDMDFEGELRTVDVHVRRLRQKLDLDDVPSIIETVFGIGYRMRCF